jgi:hypothetical protein
MTPDPIFVASTEERTYRTKHPTTGRRRKRRTGGDIDKHTGPNRNILVRTPGNQMGPEGGGARQLRRDCCRTTLL